MAKYEPPGRATNEARNKAFNVVALQM